MLNSINFCYTIRLLYTQLAMYEVYNYTSPIRLQFVCLWNRMRMNTVELNFQLSPPVNDNFAERYFRVELRWCWQFLLPKDILTVIDTHLYSDTFFKMKFSICYSRHSENKPQTKNVDMQLWLGKPVPCQSMVVLLDCERTALNTKKLTIGTDFIRITLFVPQIWKYLSSLRIWSLAFVF